MGIEPAAAADIPVALSRFCGRERELTQLRALLDDDRLVTITGIGGIGKTRLAVQVAGLVSEHFAHGVWLVELARVEDPDQVAQAVAESVQAAAAQTGGPLERATSRLSAGRQLLLLDNCEHVVRMAASVAEHLVHHCPELTVLATSREPLGVDGERPFPLHPLSVPEAGASNVARIAETESVQLFCDRARMAIPDAQLSPRHAADIATICRRLDGLPLALELAAGWAPVLSLKQIVAQLDDGLALLQRDVGGHVARHRTMRAALEWSHQLLSPREQMVFARLSVFVSGFTLESAGAVLQDLSTDDASTLQLIASLVARSLVLADTSEDEARYRLLEPVRQYSAEQLRTQPGEEIRARSRLLGYLAQLAELAEEPILGGPDQPWLRRLDAELGNIRAALAWGFEDGFEDADRLAVALIWFCYVRGLCDEGRAWAERAMQAEGRVRARAAHMAGTLAGQAGDPDAAERYLAEARDVMTKGGWRADLAMVISDQGTLAYRRGDLEAMRRHGLEAIALARELGDETRIMQALSIAAMLASLDGDHRKSCDLLREAIDIALRRGADWSGYVLRLGLAEALMDMGDPAAALEVLRDCLESSADFGDTPISNAFLVESVGIAAIQRGEAVGGLRLMGAAHAVLDQRKLPESPDEAARRAQWMDTARQSVGPEEAGSAWESGRTLLIEEAIAEARAYVADPAVSPWRPSSRARPANTFVREGEFWSITYGGIVVRIKNSKGLRDIARLLATPGREVAAVDLASQEYRDTGRRLPTTAGIGLGTETHAGEALDAEARAQYRSRLAELEDDILSAEDDNDPERASRAREESELLGAELGAAVGLGGRSRRALDPAERARKAVTGRLRDAIGHIEAAHPPLGRHLHRSVRTGAFCVYDPADPTGWRL